jgi:tetratricopeptide (TPR) repeat protein
LDRVLELADWQLRSPAFGALCEYDDGRPVVAAPYLPEEADSDAWRRLRTAWLELSPHPHVLDALDASGDALLLRYAALDWHDVGVRSPAAIGAWGAQVTDAFATIVAEVPAADARQFLRPVVRIDLLGAARVAFLPPPASDAHDERAFVHAIVAALQSLYPGWERVPALRKVFACRSLRKLAHACSQVGGTGAVRTGEQLASWSLAEEGLGWLALGRATRAFDRFDEALELDPELRVAELGRLRAIANLGIVSGTVRATSPRLAPHGEPASRSRYVLRMYPGPRASVVEPPRPPLRWSDAEPAGRAFEDRRAYVQALDVYRRARSDGLSPGPDDAAVHAAIARCQLALGAGGLAVDHARRALAIRPRDREALSVLTRAQLLLHRYGDALACATEWLEDAPSDAAAHYAHGRALLGLSRFLEARDAFARACQLRPSMLEAMLLRREADRIAARLRAHVGIQPVLELDLPEHLAVLRDPLARGRVDEMIAILARAEYDGDAAAKLVHAQCLAFARRFGDALAVFDLVSALAPAHEREVALGKAHALLALDRPEEALALLDPLVARAPDDLDAIEGRVQALQKLGRDVDALVTVYTT